MAGYATLVREGGVITQRVRAQFQERLMVERRRSESGSQVAKFKELARELECDESEEAFKAKLVKVARAGKAPKAHDRKY